MLQLRTPHPIVDLDLQVLTLEFVYNSSTSYRFVGIHLYCCYRL
jgi:hypothetical protein